MTIVVDQLTVTSPTNSLQPLLKNISCTFADGQITILVGKTGSGKSTLLNTLTGLIRPRSGTIRFDSTPIWRHKRLDPKVLLFIGSVFQQPEQYLFARTVQKEFAYSLKPFHLPRHRVEKMTMSTLNQLQLAPELLEQSPFLLSGGQKRLVALGTTLATNPNWLFLDEPTAGLDEKAVQSLIDILIAGKERLTGGVVIATHDLDVFFPIADQVLVLHEGELLAQTTPDQLANHPDPLITAGVGLPSAWEVAQRLNELGYTITTDTLNAEVMANAITRQLTQRQRSKPPTSYSKDRYLGDDQQKDGVFHAPLSTRSANSFTTMIRSLDPRTKWLFVILLSAGILWQSSAPGLVIATVFTGGLVLLANARFQDLRKLVAPYLLFILLSVGLSGLEFNTHFSRFALGFSWLQAGRTALPLYRLLLIMILGLLLPLTTSQKQIKYGLEKALSRLPGFRVPAEAIALTTALTLRFIPIVIQEVDRFSRIVRARGKTKVKPGSIRIRDLHVVTIPLLISLFQVAEHLSLAITMRGYKKLGTLRTVCTELKMTDKDFIAITVSVILFFILMIIGNISH